MSDTSRRFGVAAQWAREQWETCEAYLDYVGAIQMYNRYHAKFRRRLSPWLQVLYVYSFAIYSGSVTLYSSFLSWYSGTCLFEHTGQCNPTVAHSVRGYLVQSALFIYILFMVKL